MLRVCAAFVLICLPLAALSGPTGAIMVIDADTWDVGGQRVRVFGIDAPELAQTCKKPDGTTWACMRPRCKTHPPSALPAVRHPIPPR